MEIELVKDIIKATGSTEFEPVGSRTIPGAAGPDSDYDLLIFSKRYDSMWSKKEVVGKLRALGFVPDSPKRTVKGQYGETRTLSGYGTGPFDSFRKDDINLILTGKKEFYKSFLEANKLAVAMKLTNRDDRVTLFKYVLYGELPDVSS